MGLDATQAEKVDRDSPGNALAKVGTVIRENMGILGSNVGRQYAIVREIVGADPDPTPIFAANAPFPFEVIDCAVQPRVASTAGTMTLTDGTTPITDALTAAVDTTMDRAATIDDSVSKIPKNGTLEVDRAGTPLAEGLVTVTVVRTGD